MSKLVKRKVRLLGWEGQNRRIQKARRERTLLEVYPCSRSYGPNPARVGWYVQQHKSRRGEPMKPTDFVDKVEWYRKGWYAFPPPPVCTASWSLAGWIGYIDAHGVWMRTEGE